MELGTLAARTVEVKASALAWEPLVVMVLFLPQVSLMVVEQVADLSDLMPLCFLDLFLQQMVHLMVVEAVVLSHGCDWEDYLCRQLSVRVVSAPRMI